MRIAQIAPLMESIPPRLYGGSERVVSYLTEELVAQGHDVTLFASGQSITSAKLVPCCAQPLRLNPAVRDIIPYYMLMLDKVRSHGVRVRHPALPHRPVPFPDLQRAWRGATVTTLHGRQDLPDLQHLYRGFPDMPLVSISNAQRVADPRRQLRGHRLSRPAARPAHADAASRAAAISPSSAASRRRSASTGPSQIARARRPAAQDRRQGRSRRRGLLPRRDRAAAAAEPGIEYIGEIDERRKAKFLGDARALLFPIDWPEPFGLVDDRGDGLRHAGAGLPERLGAGGDRRRRHGLRGRQHGRGHLQALGGVLALDRGRRAPTLRGAVHGRAHGARLCGGLPASRGHAGRPARGKTRRTRSRQRPMAFGPTSDRPERPRH